MLSLPLDGLNEESRTEWLRNQEAMKQGIALEYGAHAFEFKLRNFLDFGVVPMSIFAFHNRFLMQLHRSFVVGGFYPALTGACSLGERILNHLILNLRESYAHTEEYKKVHRKQQFDDWGKTIEILCSWGILVPESAAAFRELRDIRHRSIHFRPEVDHDERSIALAAIRALVRIIEHQFGSYGNKPWFIHDSSGESYIRKAAEASPFVRLVYIPNCALVGPRHLIEFDQGVARVRDSSEYGVEEITDEEFLSLRAEFRECSQRVAAERR